MDKKKSDDCSSGTSHKQLSMPLSFVTLLRSLSKYGVLVFTVLLSRIFGTSTAMNISLGTSSMLIESVSQKQLIFQHISSVPIIC